MRGRHRFEGPLQPGVVDVVVGHEADDPRGEGAGQDPLGPQLVQQGGRRRGGGR